MSDDGVGATPPFARPLRVARVVVVMALAALVVALIDVRWPWLSLRNPPGGETALPAPYLIPKFPGMATLRLAMVHDVLHERFTRHGEAWHRARAARCRDIIAAGEAAIAGGAQPPLSMLEAMDDLAVSCDRLHQDDDAVTVMRRKLELLDQLQPEAAALAPASPGPHATPAAAGRAADKAAQDEDELDYARLAARANLDAISYHRYSCLANLGTVLVHGSFAALMGGDLAARQRVEEGLVRIRAAMRIDPSAHFGRETWQAIAIAHLLAARAEPTLLRRFDLIGEDLSETIARDHLAEGWGSQDAERSHALLAAAERREPDADGGERRIDMRRHITRVGASPAWVEAVLPERATPAPFDEPTLGLVGMWTMGGGANPHSALALGGIMERVGERHLAWTAYQRALELADRFWPDPGIVASLKQHCRDRQSLIARRESPKDPAAWESIQLEAHTAELAEGEAYQQTYVDFETARLAAGRAYDAPDLMDGFTAAHGEISTAPGVADRVYVRPRSGSLLDRLPAILLAMALGGTLALLARPGRHRSLRLTR